MAFITDFTDPGYNAYSEVAIIDEKMKFMEYVNGTIGWEDMPNEAKEAHIINATRSLCGFTFAGTLNPNVITTECVHFPRSGLEFENGTPVPGDDIPYPIHDYTACFIYTWVRNNRTVGGTSTVGMVRKKKVKNVEIEYETGVQGIVNETDSVCIDDSIPVDWFDEVETSVGGVGSIGKMRTP